MQDRNRRDQKFRFDTDTDTFSGSRSIPRLILILKVGLNRDRYWYWYQENVPGLILIPRLYLIRILPKPYKKCTSLWIDTGTDTETQKQPRSRPILIPKGLVSAVSIRYRYSRLSLLQRMPRTCALHWGEWCFGSLWGFGPSHSLAFTFQSRADRAYHGNKLPSEKA